MWGAGVGIGFLLAILFWAIFIAPDDRAYHKKRLEIVRNKLKKLEERKAKKKEIVQEGIKDKESN